MSDAFWVAFFAALVPTLTVLAQWFGQNKRMKATDEKVDVVKDLVNGKSTALEERVIALTKEVVRLKLE